MPLKTVVVKVPGTCGEWIQTVEPSSGKECLVSLPIDLYSGYRIEWHPSPVCDGREILKPKGLKALKLIQSTLEIPDHWIAHLKFQKNLDELAVGKGMASSTADILCVLAGVSVLYTGRCLPAETLLNLCCQIEPSDGTMFESCVLIDHLRGEVLETFEALEAQEILLLLPREAYETEKLRASANYASLLKQKTEKPIGLFREGMARGAVALLGEASTLSLLENEAILKKYGLLELIELSKQYHCGGIVGGHSGTVAGFLITENTDVKGLLMALTACKLDGYYSEVRKVRTTLGGVTWSLVEA